MILLPSTINFFLVPASSGSKIYTYSKCISSRFEAKKKKNVLANADCKLKMCDFGLVGVSFNDVSSASFWTDYVATR